jgi:hypothetical protein
MTSFENGFTQDMSKDFEVFAKLFGSRLGLLFEGGYSVELIWGYEQDETLKEFRALRIKSKQSKVESKSGDIVFADFDDTIFRYSLAKRDFHQQVAQMFSETHSLDQQQVLTALGAINRACRVWPPGKLRPERYAPLMELKAISTLFESETNAIPDQADEAWAREFIRQHEAMFAMDITIDADENGKTRFIEKVDHVFAMKSYETPPDGVAPSIFHVFKKSMLTPGITSPQDIEHLNLSANDYWVVSTFGMVDFQLAKIIGCMEHMKQNGLLIPDEIVVYTRGRKEPVMKRVLQSLLGSSSKKVRVFDDSVRQLSAIQTSEWIKNIACEMFHVVFPDSKRKDDETPNSITRLEVA